MRYRPMFLCAVVLAYASAGLSAQNDELRDVYGVLGFDPLSSQVRAGFLGLEIRVRTSFSYTVPHSLLVLRQLPGSGWEGSAWLWSGGLELGAPRTPQMVDSCRSADFAEPVLCRTDVSQRVDWRYVGSLVFDSLDVMTLPDPSELPLPAVGVIDGLYLFAEIADGGRYRSISWINHEVRREPEAQRAYTLHRVVDVLTRPGCWRDLLSPWPERIVRIYGEFPGQSCSD